MKEEQDNTKPIPSDDEEQKEKSVEEETPEEANTEAVPVKPQEEESKTDAEETAMEIEVSEAPPEESVETEEQVSDSTTVDTSAEDQLKVVQMEAQEWNEKYWGLLRDYKELKNRLDAESQWRQKYERMLQTSFRTIDDLELALSIIASSRDVSDDQTPDEATCKLLDNIVVGIAQVRDRLYQILTDEEELECIEPEVGAPFESGKHEAVERILDSEFPDGSVAEVIEPGYTSKTKVLRPAKVKVARRQETTQEKPEELIEETTAEEKEAEEVSEDEQ